MGEDISGEKKSDYRMDHVRFFNAEDAEGTRRTQKRNLKFHCVLCDPLQPLRQNYRTVDVVVAAPEGFRLSRMKRSIVVRM